MDKPDQQKRNLYLAGAITFAIICAVIIIYYIATKISQIGKIATTIQYAPYTASVMLDDKPLKNNSTNYIAPGEYTITVSLDNFNTLNTTVTIDENTTILYGMLTPNNERGEQIVKERQQDFLEVQSLYGAAAVEEGNKERESWPLLAYLPVNTILYSIGYILNNDQLIITVNTTTPYLDATLQKLKLIAKQAESPLEEYNIKLNNFTNPFENIATSSTSTNPATLLNQSFGSIADNINDGFYKDNYYYTTLTTGSEADYTLVTYRAVLKQTGDTWQLASTPYPILTTTNTPNIPSSILSSVNNL